MARGPRGRGPDRPGRHLGSSLVASALQCTRERGLAASPAAVTGLNAVGLVSRILIWAVVLLLVLDNLGIDVTAQVAGLGVGGVAVVLAVRNVLGDLFASLSIPFDSEYEHAPALVDHLGDGGADIVDGRPLAFQLGGDLQSVGDGSTERRALGLDHAAKQRLIRRQGLFGRAEHYESDLVDPAVAASVGSPKDAGAQRLDVTRSEPDQNARREPLFHQERGRIYRG